ncbi:Levodione reductase 2 [Colletotrichum truncatum]|uniref:Levodione reductase 2 n=1 Tax=Colletotrichum truncatum TaxID=5467 RepID=A0ACC3YUG7_COLTU|nr:Levodione reductase 2 [Colletotrichum truncatum]KAF6780884.1 Levodione reductase 2 [Colletotrichum truncatum]
MASTPHKTFSGKVIAITGAASGIGRAVTVYLANRGATLAISDIQSNALAQVVEEVSKSNPGIKIKATVVDVTKSDQVQTWISRTAQKFGPLDGAANIAGIAGITKESFCLQTDADWKSVLDVNLLGTMYSLREELKHLKDGGSIVNTSSVLGLRSSPFPGEAAYVASKHAVLGLTRNTAREYGHRNIRINCVNPGAIDTPMMQQEPGQEEMDMSAINPPISRFGRPEEVAAAIGFLLGNESSYISGAAIVVDGGLIC